MALFFSCTPATGGSTTGSGTDTGTGTTTTATTGGSTTGSGTDTGTGTTITGTSGVSFSTTYNDPTLPENIGTDPFKGHTYRNTYSNSTGSGDYGYTFGNNGELTFTSTMTSGTTTIRNGQKYSYSYDATTKELSLKITHMLQKVPGSTEYRWYTYAELINYCLNMTIPQLREMGNNTINTDEQLREYIQDNCVTAKTEFEKTRIWKAELNTSNNLVVRRSYYKTAPSSLTNNGDSYSSTQNSNGTYNSINFSLIFSRSNISTIGTISTYTPSSGTSASSSKSFSITNITSNTISAAEYTSSTAGYTLVSGGVTLQLNYTYALGNDNTLVITVTGSDDTTKEYLRTLLGDNTLTNPSITASSSTYSQTYTLVQ